VNLLKKRDEECGIAGFAGRIRTVFLKPLSASS